MVLGTFGALAGFAVACEDDSAPVTQVAPATPAPADKLAKGEKPDKLD